MGESIRRGKGSRGTLLGAAVIAALFCGTALAQSKPVGLWNSDLPGDLTHADTGTDLSLIGSHVSGGATSEWGELSLRSTSPVSDMAAIAYSVPEPCRVRISVYSVAGREVDVIVDGEVNQRDNFIQMPIDSGRMPSGVYFVRMSATGTASGRAYTQTGKMLVLR